MNYTALYRQFRPQNFRELVGQEHISRTLLNGICSDKIAHAYLFSGPRGTGKTSTAKIFAKAINCIDSKQGEPCCVCGNCQKISQGISLDVIEIDAASNRGIDEIRELREKVKYAPAEGKYKVYIIDEVHMLTTEAFNALLKTLEEPPKHIVFILATTEPHKLPATIISRCQRFDFKRIPFELLYDQLCKVSEEVNITYEEKALKVIARKAEGGMRDALSLLDQSAAFGNGKVTYDTVLEIIGAVRDIEVINLLKYIIKKDAAAILGIVDSHVASGKDLKLILHELQEAVRNTILVKLTKIKSDILDEETYLELQDVAGLTEVSQLYKILEVLAETENTLKYATQARITLEVGLLRMIAEETKYNIQTNTAAVQTDTKPRTSQAIKPEIKMAVEKPAVSNINADYDSSAVWKKLLEETKKVKRTLHAFLIEGQPIAISNNIFKIEFDPEKEFHYQQIILPDNMKLIQTCLQKLLGEGVRPEFNIKAKVNQEDVISQKVINLFGKEKVEIQD